MTACYFIKGDHGPTGEKGDPGDKGDHGDTGDKGNQGDKGDVGPPVDFVGSDPTGGTTPAGGNDGDIYVVGKRMYQYDGNTWVDTSIDISGPKGNIGQDGPKGDVGPKGDIGPTGLQGITGATGNDGTSVSIAGSYSGATSDSPSAAIGIDGSTSATGEGWINESDGYLWVWDGSVWTRTGEIRGPKGNTGKKGDPGNTGAKGDIGPAGRSGIFRYDIDTSGVSTASIPTGQFRVLNSGVNGLVVGQGLDLVISTTDALSSLTSTFLGDLEIGTKLKFTNTITPSSFYVAEIVRITLSGNGYYVIEVNGLYASIGTIQNGTAFDLSVLEKGYKGAKGVIGPKGEKGIGGSQGTIGLQGETGEKGDKGDVGPTGPKGEPAPTGADARSIDGSTSIEYTRGTFISGSNFIGSSDGQFDAFTTFSTAQTPTGLIRSDQGASIKMLVFDDVANYANASGTAAMSKYWTSRNVPFILSIIRDGLYAEFLVKRVHENTNALGGKDYRLETVHLYSTGPILGTDPITIGFGSVNTTNKVASVFDGSTTGISSNGSAKLTTVTLPTINFGDVPLDDFVTAWQVTYDFIVDPGSSVPANSTLVYDSWLSKVSYSTYIRSSLNTSTTHTPTNAHGGYIKDSVSLSFMINDSDLNPGDVLELYVGFKLMNSYGQVISGVNISEVQNVHMTVTPLSYHEWVNDETTGFNMISGYGETGVPLTSDTASQS